jgi:D-sedoheptulose 7-phosphate isomerase
MVKKAARTDRVRAIFAESARAKERFAAEQADRVAVVADRVAKALERGHTLLLFGNGGSACDASHIAAEFVNRFSADRPRAALAALPV